MDGVLSTINNRLSRSFSSSPDRAYIEPANQLITVCHYILSSEKYAIALERRYITSGSIKKVAKELNAIRLNIQSCGLSKELTNDEKEEISLKLMYELKEKLGEKKYGLLISSHGVTDQGTYFIDLNLKALQKLNCKLTELERTTGGETKEQRTAREQDFELRKVDFAQSQVNKIEAELSSTTTHEHFVDLTTQYQASKIRLLVLKGKNDLNSMSSEELPIPPVVKENLSAMYFIFLRFKEAIASDFEFQKILFEKYPEKTIDSIVEDPGRRIECFIHYVERNPDQQNTLRNIFNSIDPEVNKAKFESYQACVESIEKFSKSENNMMLSGKLGDALTHCYAFVEAEEKKHIEPTRCLIDASHFLLGYPHLHYEQQFEDVDPQARTYSGSLISIRLKIVPCQEGTIRGEKDFNDYVSNLTVLLGAERFSRLVQSTEIIQSMSGGDEEYFLYLNPTEVQTIKLGDVMQDLSSDDLKMYSLTRNETATSVGMNQVDPIAEMYKEFLAVYEIYAKFKIKTCPDTKVTFTSDPDFVAGTRLNSKQSNYIDFVRFIRKNVHYLSTVMQIFNSVNLEENMVKCARYVNQCERIAKFTYGNELKSKWFSSLAELLKCCAMTANVERLLNATAPQLLPLLQYGDRMGVPKDVLLLVAKNLYDLHEAEKKSKALRSSPSEKFNVG